MIKALYKLKGRKNAKLKAYLYRYYGLGFHFCDLICKTLGYNINVRVRDLYRKDWNKLELIVSNKYKFLLDYEVKKTVSDNIRRMIKIKSYRGHRHYIGMPANNRRTRTNGKTRVW